MTKDNLSNLLLHYGTIINDNDLQLQKNSYGDYHRIRIFRYNGKLFYHSMLNGVVLECYELN